MFQGMRSIYKNRLYFYTLAMYTLKINRIPFTISSKRIKYLGINLTKAAQDLYSEDYKTLLKEIKED